ncbi:hypothetical protein AA309_22845 [Microvirga vignae]|uniref:Uncharacterized protein n=1 Tax=Microvirga vignae TaxID=1225564 RepID=A0A0H1R7I5_9HYPH|nr:hypothetical protein [Microvirga vignae]KLK91014.1 hypothetical protein AA309_22845 [Microvirga vignae]
MADPKPCEDCQKLVARNRKEERPHDTLEWVGDKLDIGSPVADIGREAEYQCVICGSILVRSAVGMSLGWRFG